MGLNSTSMTSKTLLHLPSEALSAIASYLSPGNSLISFALLTSKLLALRLTSPSGITSLKLSLDASCSWKVLLGYFVHTRRVSMESYLNTDAAAFTPELVNLIPSIRLQVLHLAAQNVWNVCFFPVTETEAQKSADSFETPSGWVLPHRFNTLFPYLVELSIMASKRVDDEYGAAMEGFLESLPSNLQTLVLGHVKLSSACFRKMPFSLTSLDWSGSPFKSTDLSGMKCRDRLMYLRWNRSYSSSCEVKSIVSTIPESVLEFRYKGHGWTDADTAALPRGLQIFQLGDSAPTRVYNFDHATLEHSMTPKSFALFPPTLTELRIYSPALDPSFLYQPPGMGPIVNYPPERRGVFAELEAQVAAECYQALPKSLTKLKWYRAPVPSTMSVLPPRLTYFTSMGASSTGYDTWRTVNPATAGTPQSLTQLSFACFPLLLVSPLSSFIVNLEVCAYRFEAQDYALLPRTITKLCLYNASSLTDSVVPTLPPLLETLYFRCSSNNPRSLGTGPMGAHDFGGFALYHQYELQRTRYGGSDQETPSCLTDASLLFMPRTLKRLEFATNFPFIITGVGCPSNATTAWNSTIALETCRNMLPEPARLSFNLPGTSQRNASDWAWASAAMLQFELSALPPNSITDLSVDCGAFSWDVLRKFTNLITLELGRKTKIFPCLKELTSLKTLVSGTMNTTLQREAPNLPPNLTYLRLTEAGDMPDQSGPRGKTAPMPLIPSTITHLGVKALPKKYGLEVVAKAKHLKTFEFTEPWLIPKNALSFVPSNITTFILGRPGDHFKSYETSQYKMRDTMLAALPKTITCVSLTMDCRVSDKHIALFPSKFSSTSQFTSSSSLDSSDQSSPTTAKWTCQLPNLTSLSVGIIQLNGVPSLSSDLTSVYLPSTFLECFNTSHLSHLTSLKVGRMDVHIPLSSVTLPPLVTRFVCNTTNSVDFGFISRLPKQLKTLHMPKVSGLSPAMIAALPRTLTSLSLLIPMFPESALDDLPKDLTELTLLQGIYSNALLLPPNLIRLTLRANSACKQYIDEKYVQQLPKGIETLNIDYSMLTNETIKHLPSALTNLTLSSRLLTPACIPDFPKSITSVTFPAFCPLGSHRHQILDTLEQKRSVPS